MLGKKDFSPKLFYNISLEKLVPQDDYYRKLNEIIDLRFVYKLLKGKYGKTGNPSLDPVVFFKMQVYGYLENITSDRKLVRKIADSLSGRLFIGYDLDEDIPWHSTISRTRQIIGEEVFERVFTYVLKLCVDNGLVSGKHQSVDSTLVKANASLDSLEKKTPIFGIEEYSKKLKEENGEEQKSKSSNNKKAKTTSNKEYYSKTDPDSRIAKKNGTPTDLYYKTHCSVDEKQRIVTDVLTTYADRNDYNDLVECVDRSRHRLHEEGLTVKEVSADKGYFEGENLRALEERGIIPYIPSPKFPNKAGGIDKEEFLYDKEKDLFICPGNKELHYAGKQKDGRKNYLANVSDCSSCLIKSKCTKGIRRKVTTTEYFLEHERCKERMKTLEGKNAMRKRKSNSESIFAEGKQNHGLSRFNMRGLSNVQKASYMIATVLNLKRLVKEIQKGRRAVSISKLDLIYFNIHDFVDNIIYVLNPSLFMKYFSFMN